MLSDDQSKAWSSLNDWIKNSHEKYYILAGFAGTGKSYLLGMLAKSDYSNLFFTATTNKATKVLSATMDRTAKTIYSLLGLRMTEEEDKLILTPSGREPYFPKNSIIIIDEASMIGSDLLKNILNAVARYHTLRIIFVGDPAQLPPVGEVVSPVWSLTKDEKCVSVLKKVMRNDNELLNLATKLRACIFNKDFLSPIEHDINSEGEGVHLFPSHEDFVQNILKNVMDINFQETKVIAWRNKTIAEYNRLIRSSLGYSTPYNEGEIILIAAPVERDEVIVSNVDDEYIIEKRSESRVKVDGRYVNTWNLEVSGESKIILQIAQDEAELNAALSDKATIAKMAKTPGASRSAWAEFWKTKKSFDYIRYGYALTAHRAQGSTLKNCYIDQQDILANHKDREAFQCLYVAATRPTHNIFTF